MTRPAMTITLAIGAVACGLKTAPVAPELVRPLPATSLRATPAAGGVHLTWRRPTRYSGGGRMRDVERFTVERATGDAGPWTVVHTLVMADRYRLQQPGRLEWLDAGVDPGTTYRYRVVTITRDGQASEPSEPARVVHRTVASDGTTGDDAS